MNTTADRAEHDELAEWDASYVLGSLTPGDRRRFELHLQVCAACRDAVTELAGLPGLLASVRPSHLAMANLVRDDFGSDDLARSDLAARPVDDPPPAADLLPRLGSQMRRRRRRQRFIAAGSVGAVAAAALVVGVTVWPGTDAPVRPGPASSATGSTFVSAPARQLTAPESQPATVAVAVTLVSQPWGTRLDMQCRFLSSPDGSPTPDRVLTYALFVTDRAGHTSPAGSWAYGPGSPTITDPVGSTFTAADDIAAVDVRADDGHVLLRGTF